MDIYSNKSVCNTQKKKRPGHCQIFNAQLLKQQEAPFQLDLEQMKANRASMLQIRLCTLLG
jgi:hypothetical protein